MASLNALMEGDADLPLLEGAPYPTSGVLGLAASAVLAAIAAASPSSDLVRSANLLVLSATALSSLAFMAASISSLSIEDIRLALAPAPPAAPSLAAMDVSVAKRSPTSANSEILCSCIFIFLLFICLNLFLAYHKFNIIKINFGPWNGLQEL
jgi:hypothetical protein